MKKDPKDRDSVYAVVIGQPLTGEIRILPSSKIWSCHFCNCSVYIGKSFSDKLSRGEAMAVCPYCYIEKLDDDSPMIADETLEELRDEGYSLTREEADMLAKGLHEYFKSKKGTKKGN